jgi:hypothetical protein
MKRAKSDKQKERDKRGEARIAKYEKSKAVKVKEKIEPDVKTQTFYQKKDDGDWEKLEYIYKV